MESTRMFNLTYIGHAGWVVRRGALKAMFDPWLNPYGTFFNSWHQFPDNSHMLNEELFENLDFLYISHAHTDHYDEWTLKNIDKSTTVLIPNFKDKTLRDGLRKMGFSCIFEMREKDEIKIKDVNIRMLIEDGFSDRDSAIILDDGENKIVNLNDCHPSFEKVKKYSQNVDLLLLQCSSAIWWPCVYDYKHEEMIEKCKIKKKNVMERALQYAKHINAKHVVPNAGPPLFLHEQFKFWDETRREEFNPFPLQDEICDYLQQAGISSLLVIPGSELSVKGDTTSNNTNAQEVKKIYGNFLGYLEEKRREKYDKGQLKEHFFLNSNIDRLVEKFSSLILEIKKESKIFVHKINFPVLIEFENHSKWIIDFALEDCFSEYINQQYTYSFKFDPYIVNHLINKDNIDFDEYFLSMRFQCSRKGGMFNEFLFTMFKNFDIKRLKLSETIYMRDNISKGNKSETFIALVDGREKRIQKYCPHQFINLEKCGILDGETLTCPLHKWKFDLKTGKCITSDSYYLSVKDV